MNHDRYAYGGERRSPAPPRLHHWKKGGRCPPSHYALLLTTPLRGSPLNPCFSRDFFTWSSVCPTLSSAPKCANTSRTDFTNALSMIANHNYVRRTTTSQLPILDSMQRYDAKLVKTVAEKRHRPPTHTDHPDCQHNPHNRDLVVHK